MTKRKAQRVVLLPDIHHPYHNKEAFEAVLQFLKWFKPDEVILLGDAMDMLAVSHWLEEKGQRRQQENLRIVEDYEYFARDILAPIEKACPSARKIYMGGNHEHWAVQLVDKDPKLEGLVEPEICLDLAGRGWAWIPYLIKNKYNDENMGKYKIGKLLVFHGMYATMNHAKKTAETMSMSSAYCHVHDIQSFTKVHVDDPRSYHTAQSIGCLCRKAPPFMRGKANKWVNAFGVIYVRPDGHFNLYVPIIVNGKFSFCNKEFGGV